MINTPEGKIMDRRRASEARVQKVENDVQAVESNIQNTAQFVLAIVGKYGIVATIALIAVLFMGSVVYGGINKMNDNLLAHIQDYNRDALVNRFMLREICSSLAKLANDEDGRRRCYASVDDMRREMR